MYVPDNEIVNDENHLCNFWISPPCESLNVYQDIRYEDERNGRSLTGNCYDIKLEFRNIVFGDIFEKSLLARNTRSRTCACASERRITNSYWSEIAMPDHALHMVNYQVINMWSRCECRYVGKVVEDIIWYVKAASSPKSQPPLPSPRVSHDGMSSFHLFDFIRSCFH